ncbi:hypothetical protein [Moraxella oblonga]|uniref:hypothetical protein n=1 Tax=Moraxella oblonga TaxID=200413 RepID=UPI00082B2D9E|nr:hypothetical protein [Moraxella oblonga]
MLSKSMVLSANQVSIQTLYEALINDDIEIKDIDHDNNVITVEISELKINISFFNGGLCINIPKHINNVDAYENVSNTIIELNNSDIMFHLEAHKTSSIDINQLLANNFDNVRKRIYVSAQHKIFYMYFLSLEDFTYQLKNLAIQYKEIWGKILNASYKE